MITFVYNFRDDQEFLCYFCDCLFKNSHDMKNEKSKLLEYKYENSYKPNLEVIGIDSGFIDNYNLIIDVFNFSIKIKCMSVCDIKMNTEIKINKTSLTHINNFQNDGHHEGQAFSFNYFNLGIFEDFCKLLGFASFFEGIYFELIENNNIKFIQIIETKFLFGNIYPMGGNNSIYDKFYSLNKYFRFEDDDHIKRNFEMIFIYYYLKQFFIPQISFIIIIYF